MSDRTWQDNAQEWVVLGKQGKNVRLALLIACSVRRANTAHSDEKVTAREFADHVGTTTERVLRHLDAWDRAAQQRLCPPSGGMFPADAVRPDVQVPTDEQFNAVYDASNSGGRPRASMNEISSRIEIDGDYARTLLNAIAAAHPDLMPKLDGRIEDDAPRGNDHGSHGGSHGKPTNEQRAERLAGRIEQIEAQLTSVLSDIRAVKGSPFAPTATLAEQNLQRMLHQILDMISVPGEDAA